MVALNFDATKVEPDAGFETVPAGWYNVMITKDELKPTKAGTGSYLELTHDILDGQFKGRKLFARLNIVNPNVVAQEIAHKQLSGIARSVNYAHAPGQQPASQHPVQGKGEAAQGRQERTDW